MDDQSEPEALPEPGGSNPRLSSQPSAPLAFVGIGASAASQSSLEELFAHLPANSGLAYIVALKGVDGMSAEAVRQALGARSGLTAKLAEDGDQLQADHIYVAPNETLVTLADGRMRVNHTDEAPGERGAIDSMLVSLAEAEHRAIAIVLAGLGSDGTLGVRALKESGGLALAEMEGETEPSDAPISPAGIVDFLLPADKLPEQIVAYARHLDQLGRNEEMDDLKERAGEYIPRIATILRNRTGHDFHGYKANTFLRRVQRRMHVVQAKTVDTYIEVLRRDGEEVGHLFQDLLIGVTQFFRDKAEFEHLEKIIVPQMFAGKGAGDRVRVWVLGCATGEEAYSLAMLMREHMTGMQSPPQVQIFATDIDGRALALARAGRYPEAVANDIPAERLARWFTREGTTYRVHKDLREMCLFSAHNVIKDAPFSRIDLISCRNLLIYLNADLQTRVIPLFHFALCPGGFLFLGPSENVTRHTRLFQPADRKHRIFKRLETTNRVLPEFPLSSKAHAPPPLPRSGGASRSPKAMPGALGRIAEQIAERYAPAYVIVDTDHEVLHFSGRTGRYLEPSAGAANLNLLTLIHRDLRLDLRAALREAREQKQPIKVERRRFGAPGDMHCVTLAVEPIASEDADSYLVLFQDEGEAADDDGAPNQNGRMRDEDVQRLETELRLSKERLQATIEELESTNEELKSSNEEYQSINEELQSANEELETSKEELQSVNEELQTVNGELAHRVSELAKANSDLSNLLESTQIATLFLDNELRVRSFTPAAVEVFRLMESDVGRPIEHIVARVNYPQLRDDVRKVLRSLAPVEREVHNPETGARYLARALPYRSTDNFIAGALLTFLDVTAAANAEEALRESEAKHRLILESALDYAMISMDMEGKVTGWNPGARNVLGWEDAEMLGRTADVIFTPEDREAGTPQAERAIADRDGRAPDERWHLRKDGSRFWASGALTPMRAGEAAGYLKIMRDATVERQAVERQSLLLAELQHRVRNILAVVRSLASRTVETSETLHDFASHFDGRLAALARTQSIFARTGEVAVDLDELVRDELVVLAAGAGDQVEISGPSVQLRQHAGETFALALHELATNAVKYGALSHPKGKVTVSWRVYNTSTGPRLTLEWLESGVPALDPNPQRMGFGRELIERGLPYELGAATSLSFEPGGVRAVIELPLNDKTAMTRPAVTKPAPRTRRKGPPADDR